MLSKKYYSQSGLQKIIDNKIEESKQLDYKDARAINRESGTKESISKDVSSFANSEGGIIIYGMNEDKHFPVSLSYIDGNDFTKEWLENIIDSNISPKIQNIVIHPIRIDNSIEQTIYIVEIPQSPDSPHMANDNKYYRRYNFKSVPMEEYEIKNLYFKTLNTELTIEGLMIHNTDLSSRGDKLTRINYSVDFQVRNISKAIENIFKLEVCVPDKFVNHGFVPGLEKELDRKFQGKCYYSIPNSSPIFQDEIITVWTLDIEINENNYLDLNDLILNVILYYSNGIFKKDITLKDAMMYNQEALSPNHFHFFKS